MDTEKLKKVAFICPRFFSYEESIELEMKKLGYSVLKFDDRPHNTIWAKILIRLNLKWLLKKSINNHLNFLTDEIVKFDPDCLFVVSPEIFNSKSVRKIKLELPKIQTILYMWDSFSNKPSAATLLSDFDKCYSFDLHDCESNSQLIHYPLFFEESFECKKISKKSFSVSFIGTYHEGRKLLLDYTNIEKSYSHFYIQSSLVKLFRILSLIFSFEFKYALRLSRIARLDKISKSKIADIFFRSNAVVDFQHLKQTGLTCRTFEALGAGCKLITTNESIKKYPFYDTNFIRVINRNKLEDISSFLNYDILESEKKVFNEKLKQYLLSNWVSQILKED